MVIVVSRGLRVTVVVTEADRSSDIVSGGCRCSESDHRMDRSRGAPTTKFRVALNAWA